MKRTLIFAACGILSGLVPGAAIFLLVKMLWTQQPLAALWLSHGVVAGLPAALVGGVTDGLLAAAGFKNRWMIVGLTGLFVGFATLVWIPAMDLKIPALLGICCGIACAIASWLSGRL